jgi:isopentenyldiphosphate isomerase
VPDELVDIVDDDDQVIATVTRAEMRARRLQHRSVGIAVVSRDGRLLVHRRSSAKDLWPGWWDVAAGGVVTSGESYEDAARRVVHDGPFRFDDGEIVEARWVTFAELQTMRGTEQFLPDGIAMMLPLLSLA